MAQWMGVAIATVAAWLLAGPILQEYDASAVDELARKPALVQPVDMVAANESRLVAPVWVTGAG